MSMANTGIAAIITAVPISQDKQRLLDLFVLQELSAILKDTKPGLKSENALLGFFMGELLR